MSDYPGLDLFDLGDQIVPVMINGEPEGSFIPWEVLEDAFGPLLWEKFSLWMSGQTLAAGGPFPWDVERFVQGQPIID